MSALFGVCVALITVASQRIISKKRAAYDFVLTLQYEQFLEHQKIFTELFETKQLERILEARTSKELEEKLAIRDYLNHFELFAVSIRQNILDENVCKDVICDTVIKRWNAAKSLIEKLREKEKKNSLFEHFEYIATKWEKNREVVQIPWVQRIFREITRL